MPCLRLHISYYQKPIFRVLKGGIKINTDKRLFEGKVASTYTPDWKNIEDSSYGGINDSIGKPNGTGTKTNPIKIKDKDGTDLVIDDISVNNDGEVIATTEDGTEINITDLIGEDIDITSTGTTYVEATDSEGNTTKYQINTSPSNGNNLTQTTTTVTEVESESPERTEWKIKGGGAIHEKITKIAAEKAVIKYDDGLDEGCAWPDVPCENPNRVETCYANGILQWTKKEKFGIIDESQIFYQSHYGSLQYWHSMSPIGDFTNLEVKQKILKQAKEWFHESLKNDDDELSLFHIGKLLHMVQDSYSRSHVIRSPNNQIIQFQGYNAQSEELHGEADKEKGSDGYNDAISASTSILKIYKQCYNNNVKRSKSKLENCLGLLNMSLNNFYVIKSGRENVKAGGSLKEFIK